MTIPVYRATLGHLLVTAFDRHRDHIAIVDGARRLSYADMADQTARMIDVFRDLGLRRGSAMAILSDNRAELLIANAAAYVAGIRLTPLPVMSSEDDQVFMSDDAEVDALLIGGQAFGERGRRLRSRVGSLRHLLALESTDGAIDLPSAMESASPSSLDCDCLPDDISILGYTGGTTGKPKGVAQSQAGMHAAAQLMAANWEWPLDLRMLLATPISHAAGAIALPTYLKGGACHILSGFDPGKFLDYVEKERITATFLVPTMIYRLLDEPNLRKRDLGSMQAVIYGAAPISTKRLKEALEIFGPVFTQIYGQSEAPMCISLLDRRSHDPARPNRLASCGTPLSGMDVSLRDENDDLVPVGQAGEICVRGPHIMQGYWKRPEETAAALASGWLHTGDIGRFDEDGYLTIVDRKKDMIISGGFNIFPSEIEAVLATHPAVASVAVVGLDDPDWGESVTAAVVTRAGISIDIEAIRRWIRERKGPSHTPKNFFLLDELPLTGLGKVDKKALRSLLGGRVRDDVS